MPTHSAKPHIVFFTFPGIKFLDLTGPLQVFADARNESGAPCYQTHVISLTGGPITTDTGIAVASEPVSKLNRKTIDTLIVVGGEGVHDAVKDPRTIRVLQKLDAKSKRTASICTGAFLLAASGFLTGRCAVTHWDSCNRLANTYPDIEVRHDPIYVQDGPYWTSAGVTAGIDMALKLVADDLGNTAAMNVAQNLLTYVVRPGGQSQFSRFLTHQIKDAQGRFHDLHLWIMNNLDQDLRVERLATYMHMSMRTFARSYVQETGQTPSKAVEGFRLEKASMLLCNTEAPISTIAQTCGFANDEGLRRAFVRAYKTSPTAYRQHFGQMHA